MDTQIISLTITDLESHLINTKKKLNKKETAELNYIIGRLKNNLLKPDNTELLQLVLLIAKVIMQNAELFHHQL